MPMQVVCGRQCAIKYSSKASTQRKQKALKQADRKRRDALKTWRDWTKEAQKEFNAYIRARDYGRPCISCGAMQQERFTGGHFDCGHYRSTGAAAHLRFNTLNTAGQCKRCNRQLSGNAVAYRVGLIARIGAERVERLEHDNAPRTFEIDYLKRVKMLFSRRARYYKKRRGIE